MEEMIEQTSRRLPALVLISQHLDGEGPFTVLDVGPGVSGTVSFFSQFRCRLYFLDLFDQLSEAVSDPFNDIPADVRFDVCLLWDYVHFLDEQQLTLFVQALRPFIHNGTVFHLIIAYSKFSPLQKLRYKVDKNGSLILKSDDSVRAPCPRTSREIESRWTQFTVARSTLLGDNRVELLLLND